MASVLSGLCVCAAASSARFNGGTEELARFDRMALQMLACRNVCVGCVVFGSVRSSLRGSEMSSRKVGAGGVFGMRRQNWVMLRRQSGRDEAGTQVENVSGSVRSGEDSNESRMGGDESFEVNQESGAGRESSDGEDMARLSVRENMDAIGKIAESVTERLMEDSGGSSDGGGRMSQAEGDELGVGLGDAAFRRQVAMVADAGAALEMIAERAGISGGVVGNQECSKLILEALALGNSELAFSVLKAMRSSVIQRRVDRDGKGSYVEDWRWAQPNVNTYATLVRGLAASLRVADAIEVVTDVRRRGVPAGDEVPFGKVVSCPTCRTALAVVQPQQGVQVAPCAKCRYQYELMSGTVVDCESESISMNISVIERGLRVLKLLNRPLPAAVHSIVVRAPDGLARTHRCATESADIPAQEGERVTVVSAAPADSGRGIGPFKSTSRTPGWRPSEPMAVTNHVTGRVSLLSRPPPKSGTGAAFDASFIISAALLLASGDAATGLIDPSLPRAIAIGAATAVAIGGATNAFVLPRLNQLPQRTVDALALRQQLLAQHEGLQARLQALTQEAADDVRMLARMCQLQNKMEAVNEPTYSARMERVQKARETLDERLESRLELIYSYAKIASMIEIEVEMDIDVLAAEGAGVSAIAEQIERLMEVEDLQKVGFMCNLQMNIKTLSHHLPSKL
ncbi:hypothetical protein KC19_10G132400 [Ceratodon purpureus]|uniref:Uncharacterized protein n=1 Tax=Ceratodon purpureus TaxID=3225 RepID=A0A8T0GMM8_CERPU|nr:hypothetical protein KC19_10G132400 [Ceratodon purpureus]